MIAAPAWMSFVGEGGLGTELNKHSLAAIFVYLWQHLYRLEGNLLDASIVATQLTQMDLSKGTLTK
jgi:hypothetical protein